MGAPCRDGNPNWTPTNLDDSRGGGGGGRNRDGCNQSGDGNSELEANDNDKSNNDPPVRLWELNRQKGVGHLLKDCITCPCAENE